MKRLIFLLSISFLTLFVSAQENIINTNVVEVPNATKDVLYSRALEWFTNSFNNPNFVIQLKDPENGRIIAKSNVPYEPSKFSMGGTAGAKGKIDFDIKLYFKDGRFKYEVTNFEHIPYTNGAKTFGVLTNSDIPPFKSYNGMKKRAEFLWEDLKSLATATGNTIAQSLKDSLTQKTELEKEDW